MKKIPAYRRVLGDDAIEFRYAHDVYQDKVWFRVFMTDKGSVWRVPVEVLTGEEEVLTKADRPAIDAKIAAIAGKRKKKPAKKSPRSTSKKP